MDKTLSLCEKCLKVVPAEIVEKNGKVFLKRKCKNHKLRVGLIETNSEFYKKMKLPFKHNRNYIKLRDSLFDTWEKFKQKGMITPLYVTLDCNMRCPICYMHDYQTKSYNPSINEIVKWVNESNVWGISLFGGEPTCRKDLIKLIKTLKKKTKVKIICLTTNGLKLANRRYVKKIKEAGIDEVFISFSGFKEEYYVKLRGKKILKQILKALENLKKEKIQTSLMVVIKKGFNENEIESIIEYASKNNDFIRSVWLGACLEWTYNDTCPSDIFNFLTKRYGIPLEYFAELKKFKLNVFKIWKNLLHKENEESWGTLLNTYYVKIGNPSIKPVIPFHELKKINKVLSQKGSKKIFGIIKNLKHFIKLIPLVFIFISNKNEKLRSFFLKKNKILKLWIGDVQTSENLDLFRTGMFPQGVIKNISSCNGGTILNPIIKVMTPV